MARRRLTGGGGGSTARPEARDQAAGTSAALSARGSAPAPAQPVRSDRFPRIAEVRPSACLLPPRRLVLPSCRRCALALEAALSLRSAGRAPAASPIEGT